MHTYPHDLPSELHARSTGRKPAALRKSHVSMEALYISAAQAATIVSVSPALSFLLSIESILLLLVLSGMGLAYLKDFLKLCNFLCQ